jgi:hypothetical protein
MSNSPHPSPTAPNPFDRYGIRHLSPSSLSLYRHSPALWVLRYLFHVEDPASSWAWRGRAVEAGINSILLDNASDSAAIERAKYTFELSALGERSDQIDRDRRAIGEMVRRAGSLFRRLGRPLVTQQK